MCGYCMPKQCFIAMTCNSISHTIILWHVINMKLNIGKKITGLEIMSGLESELMFKGLH